MESIDVESTLAINLVGRSPKFNDVLNQLVKVSRYDVPVFVFGETGTGKELIAHAIHNLSPRNGEPFIPVNCGSIPETLVENELFGHVRGAYTDAQSKSDGLLSQANGGTLFLDEVDALSPKGQTSLLRFIQEKEFKPLGSHKICHSDVRIVTATNANILSLIDKGQFRQDLFFRLNIMNLKIPPLRERVEDIEILANHFIRQHANEYKISNKKIHPNAIIHLYRYPWPGNVRELENVLLREMLLTESSTLSLSSLDEHAKTLNSITPSQTLLDMEFQTAKAEIIACFEQDYLKNLMKKTAGNVTKAAKLAGTERRAFGKLLKKHDINRAFYLS